MATGQEPLVVRGDGQGGDGRGQADLTDGRLGFPSVPEHHAGVLRSGGEQVTAPLIGQRGDAADMSFESLNGVASVLLTFEVGHRDRGRSSPQ